MSHEQIVQAIESCDAEISRLEVKLGEQRRLRRSLTAQVRSTERERTSPPFVAQETVQRPWSPPPPTQHSLRRPRIDDEPVMVPTEWLIENMPEEGVVWLDRGYDRLLHARHRRSWSDPDSPLDCGMLIAVRDDRLRSVAEVDFDQQHMKFCERCLEYLPNR